MSALETPKDSTAADAAAPAPAPATTEEPEVTDESTFQCDPVVTLEEVEVGGERGAVTPLRSERD